MLNFCDFIQVYVFSTNHHLKCGTCKYMYDVICQCFDGNAKYFDICGSTINL